MAPFAASHVLRLQWLLTATDVQRKLARFVRATKAGFNPDQPRVPAGNSDGGQWTSGGGGSSETTDVSSQRRQADERQPQIPDKRPSTAKERNRVIKEVARALPKAGGRLGAIAKAGSWIYEGYASIQAYQDPPKSLDELRDAVSTPEPGYDTHHIVEKTPAEQDGFPSSQINAPENLVRVPRLKHWEITSWYARKSDEFGGLSPRDYLRDKDWDFRFWFGYQVLIRHGVLAP